MLRLEGNRTVRAVAYSPCGQYLAAAGHKHISVWDLGTGQSIDVSPTPVGFAKSVVFSPDGRQLLWISGASDCSKYVLMGCPIKHGRPMGTGEMLGERVDAVGFLPSGRWIAVGEGLIRAKRQFFSTSVKEDRIIDTPFAVGSIRPLLVTAVRDGTATIALFDERLRPIKNLAGPSWIANTGFGPGGVLLAGASEEPDSHLSAFAISPDDSLIAGVGFHGLVVWEVETGNVVVERPVRRLRTVAFTPDGRCLLTGGHSNILQIWETDSWQVRVDYDWQAGWIDHLAVSPNGCTAAAACWNSEIVVWDMDL